MLSLEESDASEREPWGDFGGWRPEMQVRNARAQRTARILIGAMLALAVAAGVWSAVSGATRESTVQEDAR